MNKISQILSGRSPIHSSMYGEKLPQRYVTQITQDEYDILVKHCVDFLEEKGTIEKIEDGVIHIKLPSFETMSQLALDTLLRNCKQAGDKSKWKELIVSHLTKLTTIREYDKSDFDKCKNLLSIRIYPEYDEQARAIMTYKIDFPGTMTSLVLDLPDRYESISKEVIDSWRVPIDSLYYIAQENVNNRGGVEILEAKESETTKVYSFLSRDHSASFVRDIERNAGFAIGEFGAFVAIPTRNTAFVIPIYDPSAIELANSLRPGIRMFYNTHPGNISKDIFWYNNGTFELIPVVEERVVLPEKLRLCME